MRGLAVCRRARVTPSECIVLHFNVIHGGGDDGLPVSAAYVRAGFHHRPKCIVHAHCITGVRVCECVVCFAALTPAHMCVDIQHTRLSRRERCGVNYIFTLPQRGERARSKPIQQGFASKPTEIES